MDIKHQVFVSSTYKELIEHRKAVIHALLELDCIPAGMELFPAADEDAWTLIKEVIDGCDYYLLILAGKYGTIGPSGVGYTEMEFDYAASVGKPILAFLHEAPESLPAAATEKTEALQARFATFREKAKAKHCKFWTSAEDLGGKVSRSLVQLRKRHPSPGWVRGEYAIDGELMRELEELRAKVQSFEQGIAAERVGLVPVEELAQGEDKAKFTVSYKVKNENWVQKSVEIKWNKLLEYFGPVMLHECSDEEMMDRVKLAFFHTFGPGLRKDITWDEGVIVPIVVQDQIRIQFQALGYISPGVKRRAVSDTKKYWRLTPRGEQALIAVSAERR